MKGIRRKCNLIVALSKHASNRKLLNGITLPKVTSMQPKPNSLSLSLCVCVFKYNVGSFSKENTCSWAECFPFALMNLYFRAAQTLGPQCPRNLQEGSRNKYRPPITKKVPSSPLQRPTNCTKRCQKLWDDNYFFSKENTGRFCILSPSPRPQCNMKIVDYIKD